MTLDEATAIRAQQLCGEAVDDDLLALALETIKATVSASTWRRLAYVRAEAEMRAILTRNAGNP